MLYHHTGVWRYHAQLFNLVKFPLGQVGNFNLPALGKV